MNFSHFDQGIFRKYKAHEQQGSFAVVSYDPAVTLANMLTIAVNTDAVRRPCRPAPAELLAAVAGVGSGARLARWGLHFVLDAVERHRHDDGSLDPDTTPVDPDAVRDPGAVQPDPNAAGRTVGQATDASGYDAEMAAMLNFLSPQRYQMVGAVAGAGEDDSPTKLMEAMYRLAMLTGAQLLPAAGADWTLAEVLVDLTRMLEKAGVAGGDPVCYSTVAGPYMTRAKYIATPRLRVNSESKDPVSVLGVEPATGLPTLTTSRAFGAWLCGLDMSGWTSKLMDVESNDPRLHGLHPNSSGFAMLKRAIICERINNLLLMYGAQLIIFWLRMQRPAIEAASKFNAVEKVTGVVGTLERIMSVLDIVPLHPLLSAISASAEAATVSTDVYEGKAFTWPFPVTKASYPSPTAAARASAYRVARQWWAIVPWLSSAVKMPMPPGWRHEVLDDELTVSEIAVHWLSKWAEDVVEHYARAPKAWEEAKAMLTWGVRAAPLPPVNIEYATAPVVFTDGQRFSSDPLALVHGTRALLPMAMRKFDRTPSAVIPVRMGWHQFNVLPCPYIPGSPTAVVGGDAVYVMPKWAYMGEAAYKMYFREYLRDFVSVSARLVGVFRAAAVAMGPTEVARVPRREQPPTELKQLRAARWWPSRPGAPVYAGVRDDKGGACGFKNLSSVAYTGDRFAPEMYHDAVSLALRAGQGLPDLPRDYNGGGGLLIAAQEGLLPKLFQEFTLRPELTQTPSEEQLKAAADAITDSAAAGGNVADIAFAVIDKLIGDAEVRVPDKGAPAFLPRLATLVQPCGFTLYAPSREEAGADLGEDELSQAGEVATADETGAERRAVVQSSVSLLNAASVERNVLYAIFDARGVHLSTRRPFRPVLLVGADMPLLSHSADALPTYLRALIASAEAG